MLDGKVSEVDLERKNRIIELIRSREQSYGSVALKTVLQKERRELKNTVTVVEVLHKDAQPIKEETYTYPNCVLAKRPLDLKELEKLVEHLVSNAKLQIKGLNEIPFEGYFSSLFSGHISSMDETFRTNWPADAFTYEARNRGAIPSEPFVSVDGPLFGGPWELLRLWTGIDVSRNSGLVGSASFLLPDFRARIKKINLGTGRLTVSIDAMEASSEKLVGKLYCEKLNGPILQRDIAFENNPVSIPLDFIPDWWQCYVLSKDDGEIIDYRKIHASWSSLPAGVEVELGSEDIEEIIRRGENKSVEFKQDIKKHDEFVETVVAFANTRGGSILVGVDDNCKVVGIYEQKWVEEERILSILRDSCEPMPEVKIERRRSKKRRSI